MTTQSKGGTRRKKGTSISSDPHTVSAPVTDSGDCQAMADRLQQLEMDLNVLPTPIMEIDTDFSVTFMNPAGAAVVGKTPDEVIGEKCYDLFKTPHCKTEKCACGQAMRRDSV
ncbi:MAG: PAS domain-containing protein, partial [Desulfosarcinaceae bacterium]|nr:PAS domain-containing protein [Desulfosarcinaceae bacterium]